MERPTHELSLPDAKAAVVIFDYISSGQFKEMQQDMMGKTKLSLGDMTNGNEEENEEKIAAAMKELHPEVLYNQSDMLERFLIKEVRLEDGTILAKDQVHQFVYDLTIGDGSLLSQELARINNESTLSQMKRKK